MRTRIAAGGLAGGYRKRCSRDRHLRAAASLDLQRSVRREILVCSTRFDSCINHIAFDIRVRCVPACAIPSSHICPKALKGWGSWRGREKKTPDS
eukprot:37249-Rhodomonas_salina.1